MHFLNANATYVFASLALLAIAAALLPLAARRRRAVLSAVVGSGFAARLATNLSLPRRQCRGGLLIAALALLALAGARPWWGHELVQTPRRSRDVLICLDCSRSMLAADLTPNRMRHAKWWIRKLVERFPGDRFGLIAFAGEAFLECPLTQDRNTLFLFLDDLDTDTIPVGGTNVQNALQAADEAFAEAAGRDRAVLLITDGDELQGDSADALAAYLEQGVPLFVVGLGDPVHGAPIQLEDNTFVRDAQGEIVQTRLNESGLRRLATQTHGIYVRSTVAAPNLEPVARRVRDLLPEQGNSTTERRPVERYQFPVVLAVLLLLARMFISECRPKARQTRLETVAAGLAALVTATAPLTFANSANQPFPAPDGAAIAPSAGDEAADPDLQQAIRRAEERLENASEQDAARQHYNLGLLHHRAGDSEAAQQRYLESLAASPSPRVRAAASQNLGVLGMQEAAATVAQDPDAALGMLEEAELYNLEALKNPALNEDAARNQEILLQLRRRANELKELAQSLEQQQEQTRQDTQEARDQQQQANQEQDPSKAAEKQEKANQAAQKAEESAQELADKAEQAQRPDVAESAKQARDEIRKAREEQARGNGETARKHLDKALEHLGDSDEQSRDKDQQDPQDENRDNENKDEPKQDDQGNENPEDPASENQPPEQPQPNPADSNSNDAESTPQDTPVDPNRARALLLQMAREEKDLREELKQRMLRGRSREVERNW